MSKVMEKLQELVESGDNLRAIVFRGELKPLGKIPAAEFKYTENNDAYFRGNIVPHITITKQNGETFSFDTHMPISGFGDAVLDLAAADEGTKLMILAEYDKRKSRDGSQWFVEGRILAVDLL